MSYKKHGSAFGLALLLGAIAGYIVGLFIPEKSRKKQKKEIIDKSELLKNYLSDAKERERIIKIFNKNTQKARGTYSQTREYLVTNLSELKGTIEDIDKARYSKAVKKAISQIKKDNKLPTKQLTALKKYLEEDFSLLKSKSRDKS